MPQYRRALPETPQVRNAFYILVIAFRNILLWPFVCLFLPTVLEACLVVGCAGGKGTVPGPYAFIGLSLYVSCDDDA